MLGGRRYRFNLEDGNCFYLAAIRRPAARDWPASFAILTVVANTEVARYQDRQGLIIRRNRHMAWLDLAVPKEEQLVPLAAHSFYVSEILATADQ